MLNEFNELSNRRTMLSKGSALVSACLLTAPIPVKAQTSQVTNADPVIDVKKFGATGRREDNATKAFRDAIEACVKRGGGTVNVPPGAYTVGTIQLEDNITLNIEAGATLFLSQLKEDFIEGARSMIYAENAKNIAVTGKGTLDGLAQYDYVEMRKLDVDIKEEVELAKASGTVLRRYYRKSTAMNVFMFVINDCTNFLLSDVTVINSPLWNVKLSDCDRVFVRGVYIYSDLEKGVNADGIDICSTSNVTISDSVIITADDSIVIKTISRKGKKANPSENITVTNCILSSSSTPLMIGTETEADIRHVLFNNCVIRNSNKGFGINVQDGATVSNVIFSNLTIETNRRDWYWWGSAEMCKFILLKRNNTSKLGIIKDILVENIIVHARGTSTITGHDDQPLENITLSNVQIFMYPEESKYKRVSHSLKIKGVKGLKIRDLMVKWNSEIENKWQSALVLTDVSEFIVDSFSGRQGLKDSNEPAILMDNAREGIIRDSTATEGTNTFIHVQGNKSEDIHLKYNNMKKAKKEVTFEKDELKKAVHLS
jgi:polygalacturonase